MIRHALIALALLVGCGGSRSPATPPPSAPIETATPPDDLPTTCDAGLWVPVAQEPPHYIACAADGDCVKMVTAGCCSMAHVAIRRDHLCGSSFGSTCDMVCPEEIPVHPKGAAVMRAACVASKCTLVR